MGREGREGEKGAKVSAPAQGGVPALTLQPTVESSKWGGGL